MRLAASAAALLLAALASREAHAGGIETPDSGVLQMGRGGAWLARADDPLSVHFNPAAMVRNPSGVHLGTHLLIRSHCFERLGPGGQPVSPGGGLNPAPGEVCADIPPFPNPQLAVTYHFLRRFAVGIGFVAPHKHGIANWPAVIKYENRFGVPDADHPAPQRYLMLEDEALAAYPTLSASFAITRELSVGAGFIWGVATFEFSNMAAAISTPQDAFEHDIEATISGTDAFIPGFVVSALYSPLRQLDIAAWYRFTDAIRADVDVLARANYYGQGGVDQAAIDDPANTTDVKSAGTFVFRLPMEARLGIRYHHPRAAMTRSQAWVEKHHGYARDALSQDIFDIELDLSWTNSSAVERVELRMNEGIRINGTPGFIPPNADIPRNWRDVFGVRLGGEYVPIPDTLALRAGGFFESKGVDDEYLSLDFHQAEKWGVAAGLTVRVSRFDISAAYQHTFFGTLDNGGQGAVRGLSGDRTTGYRTTQIVNGGRSSASLDEVALGVTAHF